MKLLRRFKRLLRHRAWLSVACGFIPILLIGCGMLRSSLPEHPAIPTRWSLKAEQLPSTSDSTGFKRLSTANTASPAVTGDAFWSSLGDPGLPQLVKLALQQNDDLKLSQLQVKLAQLQAALSGLSRWPDPSASLSAGVSRPLSSVGHNAPSTYRSAGINAALRYPLDIWGSAMAQREATHFDALASEDDWQAARLAVSLSVAQSRWQIAYLNRLLSNAQEDLRDATDTLHLAEVRYQAGATSRGDVVFAQRQRVEQGILLSTLHQQLTESRHAFALLVGDQPQNIPPELTDLSDTPLPVPVSGLPAQLLSRRADIHAAELRVRSSLAAADAIRLSFYPSLSLHASYGTSSPTLTDYLANPLAALNAVLTLPMVQFNTARYSRQSAEVIYQASVINFRKALYKALRETEDALSARQQLAEEALQLAESLTLSLVAERLTFIRWQQGNSDIQPWLEAKRSRRQAQLRSLENLLARKNNALELYAALGGGYADQSQWTSHAP